VTVAANATTFTLAPAVAAGATYHVTVTGQPSSPTEACSVTSGGSGVANANVTSVVVTCAVSSFTVGGTISGPLTGTGLVVTDSVSGAHVTVAAGATTFTLAPAIASGATYHLSVTGQPAGPTESCSVSSGANGVVGGANIASVVVTCAISTFTVGGTITGLVGTGLVLTDSVGHGTATPAAAATAFTIAPAINSGATYHVTVTTQPSTPTQSCAVTSGGSGTVTTANIATIVVSCQHTVFVANTYDNTGTGTIGVFAIDPTTGALTASDGNAALPAFVPATTDNNPTGLAVDPTGPYLYVANAGTFAPGTNNDVATFTIGATGTLTEGTPVTISTTNQPLSVGVDPAGPYLYVGSNDTAANGAMEAFAPAAGVLGTQLSGSPALSGNTPYGLAVDSALGVVFEANDGDGTIGVYAIGVGGVLTQVTNSPFAGGAFAPALVAPFAVAVYPTGAYVYITDPLVVPGTAPGTVNEFTYSAAGGGAMTLVNSYAVGTDPEAVTIDPAGQFLYVSNGHDGTVSAFTINASTGALSPILGTPFTSTTTNLPSITPTGLAVDPTSQFLYVANGTDSSITVFAITAGTGVLTAVGGTVQATNLGGAGTTAIAIQ